MHSIGRALARVGCQSVDRRAAQVSGRRGRGADSGIHRSCTEAVVAFAALQAGAATVSSGLGAAKNSVACLRHRRAEGLGEVTAEMRRAHRLLAAIDRRAGERHRFGGQRRGERPGAFRGDQESRILPALTLGTTLGRQSMEYGTQPLSARIGRKLFGVDRRRWSFSLGRGGVLVAPAAARERDSDQEQSDRSSHVVPHLPESARASEAPRTSKCGCSAKASAKYFRAAARLPSACSMSPA